MLVAFALLLALPTLASPLSSDDLIQRVRVRTDLSFPGFDGAASDLFVFASGTPEQRTQLMEQGVFSWMVPEGLKLAFWRPLSVVTHQLDFALWEESSVLIHAHSLLWFGLLLVVAGRLYQRFHPPAIAGLALALYAFDDARGMVLSFAANRNALIAAFFGVCALLAHDRWRREGWRPGALLGPALLGAGLLAGESAIATTGFLFGHAVSLQRGPLRRRLACLLPYAAVVVAWQLCYSAMGYGTWGSGLYVHPLRQPGMFVAKLFERAPILAAAQLAGPPSDVWIGLPPGAAPLIFYGVSVGVALAGMLLLRKVEFSG